MIGQDSAPRDPKTPNKYLKGENPADCAFATQREMLDAMARPEYETDAEYRAAVAVMVANSDFSGQDSGNHNAKAAAQRRADWKTDEDRQILREHIESMMNDPKYETSALFRRQVREQIAAHPDLFELAAPTPTRVNGRVQLDGSDYATTKKALDDQREAAREQAKKDAIAEAERRAGLKYFDLVTGEASDE
jgi:hypothetical protein